MPVGLDEWPSAAEITNLYGMTGNLAELGALLDKMAVGFLTTVGREGHFHSRPMELQEHEADGTLWFATSLESHKIEDLRANPRCCVAFLKDSKYVSISGHGELVQDRARIRQMWTPAWRGWFPEGPEQKDLVLLKVVPEHVEYVDPPGGTLRSLYTRLHNALKHEREEPAEKKELEMGETD
jgi:general stress protein 26